MKRIWFSVIFLFLAICLCFYEQYTVKEGCKELTTKIELAIEADDNNEKLEYCREINDYWDKFYDKSTIIADHSFLETADACIGMLEETAKNNNDKLDEVLIEAKSEVRQIYESAMINFSNIF